MIVDYTRVKHIYLVCGKTDMRKSIDGLAALVQDQFDMDVFDDCLFLENGVIQWPRSSSEVRNISQQELRWLLEGLSIEQPKAIKKVAPGYFH